MTTGKILWGTAWRGGAWGLLAGTMLGTAYGAVFANVLLFFGLLAQDAARFQPDDIPRAIFAVLFFALIGSVMGALFGVPTGLVVGLLNGLLIGIVTRIFFYPLRDARLHRLTIAILSGLLSGVASWFGFLAIMLFYANRAKADAPVLAIGVAVPALFAGIAAALISRLIARWYEKEIAK